MRNLISYFAKQGIFVDLITLFVFVSGLSALVGIKREVFPNISFDLIVVTTVYPGASAETIEKLITNPIEQDLNEVDGIKKMTSTSIEGASSIILQLDPDQTTVSEAKEDIKEVLDRQQDLPEDAEDPVLRVAESKLTPVLEIGLNGDVDEKTLRKDAKFLEREIEKLSEVAKVQFNGLRDYEIRVEANPEKLQEYRVSLSELMGALRRSNVSIPGGTIQATEANNFRETIVRTVGDFESVDDVANTVIRANVLAEPILVKDVATVTTEFEKESKIYRVNGGRAVSITVLKKERSDVVDLVDNVKKKIKDLKPKLNPGVNVDFLNDSSFYVRRRISVLSSNMLIGLGLVLVVLSLVLPLRVALVTAFGIPFAFLGTIGVFYLFGISINLISMMGLIIVLGMLVDDAVVVTENAQRVREQGVPAMEAAIKGTQQIWAPVTVSVLTTIMAFAPMVFMSGIFGKFVKYIPIGVIIALVISLWECFFVLPHHVGKWIPDPKPGSNKKAHGGVFNSIWRSVFEPGYSFIIFHVMRWRWLVVFFAFVLIGGTLKFAKDHMDFVLFPPGGVEIFVINIDAPNGSSLEYTARKSKPIEQALKQFDKSVIDDYTLEIGAQKKDANDPAAKTGSEYGQVKVYLTPATERDITARQVIERLREIIGEPEGLKRIAFEQISGGPPVGKPVAIEVRGRDYATIMEVVELVTKELSGIDGVVDLQNNYILGKREIQVIVDTAEAAAAGLSVSDIGTAVRASFEGIVASSIRKLDDEVDIRVSLTQKDRSEVSTLDQIEVSNARGQLIPLSRVIKKNEGQSIAAFRHQANEREVAVVADIDTKITNTRKVTGIMREKVDKILESYPDITIEFGGENKDTQESLQSLLKAFLFAFFGILLILILLFKNIYQPLVVAFTIPLGFVGVVWAFFAHQIPLSFLGMIGVIALGGVVVNNAIVLVDFINKLREQGEHKISSIRKAARIRLRPIFLTTLTTVCGILPTAYGVGGLDPFVVPIALALGWGLAFGAFTSTMVIPATIGAVDDIIDAFAKLFAKFGRKS